MYNTQVLCTYPQYNRRYFDIISTSLIEEEDDKEDPEMSDIMYQTNLLQAFNMTSFDNDEINMKIGDLYNLHKSLLPPAFLLELANQMFSDDILIGFMILFSYDYFHATHQWLCNITDEAQLQYLTTYCRERNKR